MSLKQKKKSWNLCKKKLQGLRPWGREGKLHFKISPTYPWKIPLTLHEQFLEEFVCFSGVWGSLRYLLKHLPLHPLLKNNLPNPPKYDSPKTHLNKDLVQGIYLLPPPKKKKCGIPKLYTLQGTNISHLGKRKNHLQKCPFFRGCMR